MSPQLNDRAKVFCVISGEPFISQFDDSTYVIVLACLARKFFYFFIHVLLYSHINDGSFYLGGGL